MHRLDGSALTFPSTGRLDVSGDIAVARASSSEFLEYLSLGTCNGQWAIITALLRLQRPGTQARSAGCEGRHQSWIVFMAVAAMAWLGSR